MKTPVSPATGRRRVARVSFRLTRQRARRNVSPLAAATVAAFEAWLASAEKDVGDLPAGSPGIAASFDQASGGEGNAQGYEHPTHCDSPSCRGTASSVDETGVRRAYGVGA